MIWILVLVALAATASSYTYDYTGTILLTQDDFCSLNHVRKGRCESTFQNYLAANPHLVRCSHDKPYYSNHCQSLPLGSQACALHVCNKDRYTHPDRMEPEASETRVRMGDRTADDEPEIPEHSGPLHQKVMDFSLKLFKAALPRDIAQNYILSPMLVQSLLCYLIDGASNVTRRDMKSILQLSAADLDELRRAVDPSGNHGDIPQNKLAMASQIFRSTQIDVFRSYQESLKRKQMSLEPIDFSNREYAVKTINDWVKLQTRQKILEVVDAESLHPETQLLLLNALYFNGTWMYKFNKTDRGVFHLNEREQSAIKMMFLTRDLRNGHTTSEDSSDGFFWIELPYLGDTVSMILLLPKERFQLNRELQKFTAQDLLNILAEIDVNDPNKVRVQLPEFKAESTVSLVDPLRQMGLASVFDGEKPFDKISSATLKISDVKQKSFVTVNPHGTVATSVTLATVIPLSISRTSEFVANQPFVAIIVDKANKLPLFFARISHPEKFGKVSKENRT